MPRLVEDAGPPLSARALSKLVRLTGQEQGEQRVGGRAMEWELGAGALTVSHAPGDGSAEPLQYPVGLTYTHRRTGGSCMWWGCPACGARVGDLYLLAGCDRLACRKCCGLLYCSQYSGKNRPRKRRPAAAVLRERSKWTAATGWVIIRKRKARL